MGKYIDAFLREQGDSSEEGEPTNFRAVSDELKKREKVYFEQLQGDATTLLNQGWLNDPQKADYAIKYTASNIAKQFPEQKKDEIATTLRGIAQDEMQRRRDEVSEYVRSAAQNSEIDYYSRDAASRAAISRNIAKWYIGKYGVTNPDVARVVADDVERQFDISREGKFDVLQSPDNFLTAFGKGAGRLVSSPLRGWAQNWASATQGGVTKRGAFYDAATDFDLWLTPNVKPDDTATKIAEQAGGITSQLGAFMAVSNPVGAIALGSYLVVGGVGENIRRTNEAGVRGGAQAGNVLGNAAVDAVLQLTQAKVAKAFISNPAQKLGTFAVRESLINAGAFTGGVASKGTIDKITGVNPEATLGDVLAEAGIAGLVTVPASIVSRYSISGFRQYHAKIPSVKEENIIFRGKEGDEAASPVRSEAVKKFLDETLTKSAEHPEALSNFDTILLKTAFDEAPTSLRENEAFVETQRKVFANEYLKPHEVEQIRNVVDTFAQKTIEKYGIDSINFANKIKTNLPDYTAPDGNGVRLASAVDTVERSAARILELQHQQVELKKQRTTNIEKQVAIKQEVVKVQTEIAARKALIKSILDDVGLKASDLANAEARAKLLMEAAAAQEPAVGTMPQAQEQTIPIEAIEDTATSISPVKTDLAKPQPVTEAKPKTTDRGLSAMRKKYGKEVWFQKLDALKLSSDEISSGAVRTIQQTDGTTRTVRWEGTLNIPREQMGDIENLIPKVREGEIVQTVGKPTDMKGVLAREAQGEKVPVAIKEQVANTEIENLRGSDLPAPVKEGTDKYLTIRQSNGGDITDIASWGNAALQEKVTRETSARLAANPEYQELVARAQKLKQDIEAGQTQAEQAKVKVAELEKSIAENTALLEQQKATTKTLTEQEKAIGEEVLSEFDQAIENERLVAAAKARLSIDTKALEKYRSLQAIGEAAAAQTRLETMDAIQQRIQEIHTQTLEDFVPFDVPTTPEAVIAQAEYIKQNGLVDENLHGIAKLFENQVVPFLPESLVAGFKRSSSYMSTLAKRNPYARMIMETYHNTIHAFSNNIKRISGVNDNKIGNTGLQAYLSLNKLDVARMDAFIDYATNARLRVNEAADVQVLRDAGANDLVIQVLQGIDTANKNALEVFKRTLVKELYKIDNPSENQKRSYMDKMAMIERLQSQPFYTPFYRRGAYPIEATLPEGTNIDVKQSKLEDIISPFSENKREIRYHGKTPQDAQRAAEKLRKAGYKVEVLPQIEFKLDEVSSLPPHILALIPDQELQEYRLRGYGGRFAEKEFVAGYDRGFREGYVNFFAQTAAMEGRRALKFNLPLILTEMENSQRRKETSLLDLQIARDWTTFLSQEHKASKLKSALFHYYLYGNFKSAFGANLTQTYILGVPLLAKEVGYAKALKYYSKGWATAIGETRAGKAVGIDKLMSKGLREDIERYSDIATRATLASQMEGDNMRVKAVRALDFFSHVEVANGRAAFAARWLSLREKLGHDLTPEQAQTLFTRAADHAREVNFVNTYANYPKFQRNISTLFMFRNFTGQFLSTLTHASPKTAMLLSAHLMLLGGGVALPIVKQIVDLLENGLDIDVKRGTKQAMGDEFGAALLYGIPASLAGLNISGSVSLGEVVPEIDQSTTGWELAGRLALGVTADPFVRVGRAADYLGKDNAGRALESVLPEAVRAPVVAGRWEKEGVRSSTGDTIIPREEVTGADIAKKSLGFQPTNITQAYDRNQSIRILQEQRKAGADQINMKLAKIFVEEGEARMKAAWTKFVMEQYKKPEHLRVSPDPKAIKKQVEEMGRGTFPQVRKLPVPLRGEATEILEGR